MLLFIAGFFFNLRKCSNICESREHCKSHPCSYKLHDAATRD